MTTFLLLEDYQDRDAGQLEAGTLFDDTVVDVAGLRSRGAPMIVHSSTMDEAIVAYRNRRPFPEPEGPDLTALLLADGLFPMAGSSGALIEHAIRGEQTIPTGFSRLFHRPMVQSGAHLIIESDANMVVL